MAEAVEKLISELKGDCLTPHQLYRLGQVLYSAPQDSALVGTCQKLLPILPQELFEDLDEALMSIPWSELESITSALKSVLALNRLVKSPTRKNVGLIHHLISNLLTATTTRPNANTSSAEVIDLSLELIRLYFLYENDIESFLPIVHQLQENQFLWSKLVQLLSSSSVSWQDSILRNFPMDQRDYLSNLLMNHDEVAIAAQSSSIKTAVDSVKASSKKQLTTKERATKTTPEQEITRRIEQVKSVVPDYGDGFVEAALSQFQGNVETTVGRLLEPMDTWPTVLQTLDQRLPRRAQRKFDPDDPETREIVKARIKEAAAQEERDALLLEVAMRHDEYEDDYDDQYDDIDEVGNVDTQDDYEAVRTYNRVLRGIEAEQKYFEDIRNTNRGTTSQQSAQGMTKQDKSSDGMDDEEKEKNGEKTYRGPDKLRGGRIPGRDRGGRPSGQRTGIVGEERESTKPKSNGEKAKPNLKTKQRQLDKRRTQQKNAQVNRAG